MDLGATVCTPARPACLACPWRGACRGHTRGLAATLPRRAPKPAKPLRRGIAWVALDPAGRVLTERRADRGLLGGMLAVPSSEWTAAGAASGGAEAWETRAPEPPLPGGWAVAGEVRHVFTHFNLGLEVRVLRLTETGGDGFLPAATAEAAMPTVFAKAVRLARGGRGRGAPITGR
jgi:A/G-specific adenine glycosylase